jgi:H+/gluconate symporter-like permease
MEERILDDGDLSQLQETKLKKQLSKLSWWLRFGAFMLVPLGSIAAMIILGAVSGIYWLELLIGLCVLIISLGVAWVGYLAWRSAKANDNYNQEESVESYQKMALQSAKLWRTFGLVLIPIFLIGNGTMAVVVYDDYSWRNYTEGSSMPDFPIEEPVFPDEEMPLEEQRIIDGPTEVEDASKRPIEEGED